MEEGSLLSEALSNARIENLENALVVDVFLLPAVAAAAADTGKNKEDNNSNSTSSNSNSTISINLEQHLLDLADLGVRLNDFMRQRCRSHKGGGGAAGAAADNDTTTTSSLYYPWIQGGDGPVFGIHTSLSNDNNSSSSSSSLLHTTKKKTTTVTTTMMTIPHLRAICRYGVSVADEWKMIGLVMEFSSQHHNTQQQQQMQDEEKKKNKTIMVVECMDVDDGQILMIQGADALPEWADLIGSQNCRHRCWIKQGKIHLIAPPTTTTAATATATATTETTTTTTRRFRGNKIIYSLSLSQALDCLLHSSCTTNNNNDSNSSNNTDKNLSQYHAGVHGHAQQAVDRVNNNNNKYCQRTALLVPRSVANLVTCRPDLAAAAYQAWAHQRQQQHHQQQPQHGQGRRRGGDDDTNQKNNKDIQNDEQSASASASSLLLAGTCHDWIWTIDNHMSRTVYAMMRTIVSSGSPADSDDDWTRPDSIPKRYQSIEVKRLQRHVQSLLQPPVLQSSLALGVRLVAGLQLLLQQQQTKENSNSSSSNNIKTGSMRQSYVERRVLDYWSRIDRQCRCVAGNSNTTHNIGSTSSTTDTINNDDDNNSSSWLVQAWIDGPNHSQYSIESIMKCPVFAEEVQDDSNAITPLSHPGETLADQIRHELLRQPIKDPLQQQQVQEGEMPRPDQVDTDEWMTLPSLAMDQDLLFQQTLGLSSFNDLFKNSEAMNENNENNGGGPAASSPLDHMLHGFQDFIQGESGIDGVDHYCNSGNGPKSSKSNNNNNNNNNSSRENVMPQQQQPIRIHPVAFLNLLHKSLATDSAQELETFLMGTAKTSGDDHVGDDNNNDDHFFSEEDYRLAEPDNTDDDDDDDDEDSSTSTSSGRSNNGGNNDNDEEMMHLMDAMDSQLLEHDAGGDEALSRPGTDVSGDDALLDATSDKQHQEQAEIARDVHVLSNLIESLEAGAGAPGPVQNILSEMSGK